MARLTPAHPVLTLVRTDPGPRQAAPTPPDPGREWAVRAENRLSSSLTDDDARWMLANLAEQAIEGGRAGIIRPEVRRRLVAAGVSMGLRPFDANLVIAIVQDDARSGTASRDPASSQSVRAERRARQDRFRRVGLVRPPARSAARKALALILAALVLGLAGAIALARWITGG